MKFRVLIICILFAVIANAAPPVTKKILRLPGAQVRFPYSPGIIAGDFVFLAGQGSRDPKTGQHPAAFDAQVRQAIENVRAVLQSGGMDLANLTSCNVYLDDLKNYDPMNKVYGEYFKDSPPVRTTVAVPALPDENHVEITCVGVPDAKVKKPVYRGRTPRPGLFPPGVEAGNCLFTSGAGSRDPATSKHPDTFAEQVAQSLTNLKSVLDSAQVPLEQVDWANVYVDDAAKIPEMEQVYAKFFAGNTKPAHTVTVVSALPGGSHVEITLLAGRGRATSAPWFISAQSGTGATIEDQVKSVMAELKKTLLAQGMNFSNVVSAHVYLADMADFAKMNAVYRTYFPDDPPARTTMQAGRKPGGSMIEIAVVATK